ncbi:YqeB family protein [Bacillus niameyensis]|uniref:YqeB family protein n=1 Tax=Bacillus niameyensis TaxID=1522308 RepID=UPI0007867657|nr:hypothetical protein [Bacillus niameyensis]
MTPFQHDQKTVVGYSNSTGILLYGGFGIVGLILGYFLPRIATWAISLPWFPFEGLIKLINTFNGFWLQVTLPVLGLIAGLILAAMTISELLIVTITNEEVSLKRGEDIQTIALKDIAMVFLDGKELVILGKSGYELARELTDESAKKIVNVFKDYDYPWSSDGDPFKDDYRRWVLDTPDISPAANALLKAREIALQKKEKNDIKDLRKELAKVGYIVRDEETRQYFRKIEV